MHLACGAIYSTDGVQTMQLACSMLLFVAVCAANQQSTNSLLCTTEQTVALTLTPHPKNKNPTQQGGNYRVETKYDTNKYVCRNKYDSMVVNKYRKIVFHTQLAAKLEWHGGFVRRFTKTIKMLCYNNAVHLLLILLGSAPTTKHETICFGIFFWCYRYPRCFVKNANTDSYVFLSKKNHQRWNPIRSETGGGEVRKTQNASPTLVI